MITKPYIAPLLGLLVTLSVGLVAERIYTLEKAHDLQNQRTLVVTTLGQYRAAIESGLSSTLYLANGLVSYIQLHPKLKPTEARAILKNLYKQNHDIRNIGLAPDNRLSYIFPEKGNERALGLYYPDLPEQWPVIQKSIAEHRPILAGPVRLVQGGGGFIYRVPVFIGSDDQYWGILSLVIDEQHLLNTVGIAPHVGDIQFALRGTDSTGVAGETFMGDPSLFKMEAVTATISTPGGNWQIAARPIKGWAVSRQLVWLRSAAWALAIFLGLMIYTTLSSITLRLNAQKAIKSARDELNEAQRLAKMGNWVLDMKSSLLTWSPGIYRIFELNPDEFSPSYEAFLNTVHPDDREMVDQAFQESVAKKTPYDIAHRLLFADGRIKYVRENGETLYSQDDSPVLSRGTVQDITVQEEVEQALHASEERWRFALEGAEQGVWDWNIETGDLFLSKQEMSVLGYDGDPATCSTISEWVDKQHPDDLPIRKSAIERYFSGQAPIYEAEFRSKGRDGNWRWIHARGMIVSRTQDDKPLRMLGTHTDITARKHTEEKLREQNEFLWTILETEPECVKVVRADGWIEQMNAAGLAMLEVDDIQEANQHGLLNFVLPEYREAFSALEKSVQQGEDAVLIFAIQGKKGTKRWLETHAAPLHHPNDPVVSLVAVSRDITERREAEQRLSLSLQGADLAITDWNIARNTIVYGDEWVDLLGYQLDELPSSPSLLEPYLNPKDIPNARVILERHLRDEIPSIEVEMRVRHKDGHWVWVLARGMVVERDSEGSPLRVAGTVMDISRRKSLEQELIHLATTDPLTGVANRRKFMEKLEVELARFMRFAIPSSFFMVDIDHFKRINDTYGHGVGDQVLRHFADLATKSGRRIDVFGRLGGEEFGFLLPGTDLAGALQFAEKFRGVVSETPASTSKGMVEFSISVGVTTFQTEDTHSDSILTRADEALYMAKGAGRNRVEAL